MTTEQTELNPVHVPRTLLLMVGAGYLVWFFVIPLVFVLRMGRLDYLFLPAGGLLLIPFAVMTLFVRRLILYFYYRFFWYITGMIALLSVACGGILALSILVSPSTFTQVQLPANPEMLFSGLPVSASTLNGGAVVMFVLGIIALWWMARRFMRADRKVSTPIPVETQNRNDPETELRRQLAERMERLDRD